MQLLHSLTLIAAVCGAVASASAAAMGPLDAIDINIPRPPRPAADNAKRCVDTAAAPAAADVRKVAPVSPANNPQDCISGQFAARYIGCFALTDTMNPEVVTREVGQDCPVACYRNSYNFGTLGPTCRCLPFVDGANRVSDTQCAEFESGEGLATDPEFARLFEVALECPFSLAV